MNILTIESSTDIELISVSTDTGTTQFAENTGLSHSTGMFGNISALLDSAGMSIRDINLIGVGIGPGSFTGVRIAVSTARMIAQILAVPLVGIKSHEIWASSCDTSESGLIAVAFDAKKSRVYAGLYSPGADGLPVVISEPADLTIGEFIQRIPRTGLLTCIGSGFEKYSDELRDYCRTEGVKYRIPDNFMPSGKAASMLVRKKFAENPHEYSDYSGTVPSYERLSDAECAAKNRI